MPEALRVRLRGVRLGPQASPLASPPEELASQMTAVDHQRLTQPDWCNAPQPGNWRNACMRLPDHTGHHAVRKSYRPDEAWFWSEGDSGARWRFARDFDDLWDVGDPYDRMLAVDWTM